ncbi:hypothetical protein CPC08DRAFT_650979 [Agrocybe pediades]|nr:hypothetical protein CPC08DRAFT_650979 [Agrocybe pediades]
MRQRSQTKADAKLRAALENMRYAACTPEDIAFLKSLIVTRGESRPSISHPDFRNVSIITAWNVQKDRVNEIGCQRFANDTGQVLQHFYSVDRTDEEMKESSGKRRRGRKPRKQGPARLDEHYRTTLWNSAPCTSEHVAGKLSLCIGMPVMIRHNYATELCITKGQEGTVHGWDDYVGPHGQPCLDTLYVKLSNPPRDINIPGLETNVVPIPKSGTVVTCKLPDDSTIRINRTQICVLPNFAMTDYASQGKTRPFNVVDLGHCRSHQSYYTCLSRSGSAGGTLILQGFDTRKIMSGISGHLRQEFRELEMLNDITRLRYSGKLPDHVNAMLRRPLIRLYQKWKVDGFEGSDWHPSIKWSMSENKLLDEKDDLFWNEHTSLLGVTTGAAKGKESKRKTMSSDGNPHGSDTVSSRKKPRSDETDIDSGSRNTEPVGLIWDNMDFSCAYDSTFTVLYNIWKESRLHWTEKWTGYSEYMASVCREFGKYSGGFISFEDARDKVRRQLHDSYPDMFAYGSHCNTDLSELMIKLLGSGTSYGLSTLECEHCHRNHGPGQIDFGVLNICTRNSAPGTTYNVADALELLNNMPTRHRCGHCRLEGHRCKLIRRTILNKVPDMLVVGCSDGRMTPELELHLDCNGSSIKLSLSGIVYGDGVHFVSRFVDRSGTVWFHDGAVTGRTCVEERRIDLLSDTKWLVSKDNKRILYAYYVVNCPR